MLNSHSSKALKNKTKLYLEEFCLRWPGLLFCEEDFCWFLLFAPLLLLSETTSPSRCTASTFFSVCSAIHADWFYNLLGLLVFIGSWKPSGSCSLARSLAQTQGWFCSKVCGGSVWVWESLGQILLCCTSSPASLGSSLHHLWRDKRLIKIFFFFASGQPAKLLCSLSSLECDQ